MNIIKTILTNILILAFLVVIYSLSIRGIHGNITETTLTQKTFTDEGPLELSPERGRFALLYSVVENKSLHFSVPVAKFATPDLAISKDGKYVSLFAPGVSFIVIPGYVIGKYFNISQVGAFAVIALFAIFNFYLVRAISKILGANNIASTIAGLIFVFGTPAFSYAVTLYQHHISTFLVLGSLYLLLRFKESLWPLFGVAFLSALSLSVDYPNFVLIVPLIIFSLLRVIKINKLKESYAVQIRLLSILTALGAILPMLFFFWFSYYSYGNPLQLSGTLKNVRGIDAEGKPMTEQQLVEASAQNFKSQSESKKKTASGFFKTRNMLNGFYVHFLSPDRGIIYYTPVVLLGIVGVFILYKKNRVTTGLLLSIIGSNILLYSMWGDPWGGWAYGSRYLVPAYSLLSIFLAIALDKYYRNFIFIIIFAIMAVYSIEVSTLGALTTNRLPPEGEAKNLELTTKVQEKYSYARSYDYLLGGNSKSYFYNTYAVDYITADDYYLIVSTSILVVLLSLLILNGFKVNKNE